jgi:hypothetical protein
MNKSNWEYLKKKTILRNNCCIFKDNPKMQNKNKIHTTRKHTNTLIQLNSKELFLRLCSKRANYCYDLQLINCNDIDSNEPSSLSRIERLKLRHIQNYYNDSTNKSMVFGNCTNCDNC